MNINAIFTNHMCHERRRHEQWRLQIRFTTSIYSFTSRVRIPLRTPKKVMNELHALRKGSSLLARSLTSFNHVSADTIAESAPVAQSSSESDSCLPDGLKTYTRKNSSRFSLNKLFICQLSSRIGRCLVCVHTHTSY